MWVFWDGVSGLHLGLTPEVEWILLHIALRGGRSELSIHHASPSDVWARFCTYISASLHKCVTNNSLNSDTT